MIVNTEEIDRIYKETQMGSSHKPSLIMGCCSICHTPFEFPGTTFGELCSHLQEKIKEVEAKQLAKEIPPRLRFSSE